MKTIRTLAVFVVLLVAAGLAFIFSGFYDVAADTEHTNPVQWVLRTTQSRSVHRRAEEVQPPAWMAAPDPAVVSTGLMHYQEMCATCHGAPGVPISAIGQGLNPAPPELSRHADEPGENFWIIKHGIKMTGMPAFGVSHSDEEIWAIVAFLQAMPNLTKEEYQKMIDAAWAGPGEGS
jgi:mono/diheme cytochrome c family protein